MTQPEQKFKQWALDPNGGGWKEEPKATDPPFELLTYALDDWEDNKAAFLAGYNADRWIRVEDGLPGRDMTITRREVSVDVIITWGESIHEGYYQFEDKKWICYAYEYGPMLDVTHWQPLPKSPSI